MKKVFIVGGDGFARECYMNLTRIDEYNKEVIFGGFLGHGGYGHTVDYKEYQHLYKGEVADYKIEENDYFIIGAGYGELRIKIYNDLKALGCKFYTLIGKGVELSDSFKYGEANIFTPPFLSSVSINIGNGNVFNGSVVMGHDVEIGDFNFFGPSTNILGNVKIGNMNTIGVSSIFLPKSKIGNNNKISPMSVIYKGCKDNCYMAGNPAIKIGEVE